MSFLNPVNEPVLRFKSTDAGAPQINYNARTAGDVKAVLKACLVTGYGSVASAGWSVANEVNHVAEFVSPSAAMSDYRLGVDDTSTSSTTWYYQYQGARTNPPSNAIARKMNTIIGTSARNGWQLLVTDRGVILIEHAESSLVADLLGRVTYWGSLKSALADGAGVNIAFWSAGLASPSVTPYDFFTPSKTNFKHYRLGAYGANLQLQSVNILGLSRGITAIDTKTAVDLFATLYLYSDSYLAAEQPCLIVGDVTNTPTYGVYDSVFLGRPVVSVCLAWDIADASALSKTIRTMMIYLDNWEY